MVQATARHILSETRFGHGGAGWVQRFLDWLGGKLGINVGAGAAGTLALIVLVAILVLIGLAVFAIVRGLGAAGRLRHPEASGVVVSDAREIGYSPEAWLEQADHLAAEGQFRAALRCRYRALVAELARRHLLAEVPGRTTGEYARLVSRDVPGAGPAFSQATKLFEGAWYGDEPAGLVGQQEFQAAYRAVVVAAEQHGHRSGGPPRPDGQDGGLGGTRALVGSR